VFSRDSYYFGNNNAEQEHPPFDYFPLPSNHQDVYPTACFPFCPSGFSPVPKTIPTENITAEIPGYCIDIPSFVPNGQLPAGLDFDPCCDQHQRCALECTISKEQCDQEFYACLWDSCSGNIYLRPGDRLNCKAYATCYASSITQSSGCSSFRALQSRFCECENSSLVASPSPSVNESGSESGSEEFFSNSASPVIPGLSLSASPVSIAVSISVSPNAGLSISPSPAFQIKKRDLENVDFVVGEKDVASRQTKKDESSDDNIEIQRAFSYKAIPNWNLIQGKCPPNFMWIEVATDQENEDIFYYFAAASSLNVWWKLW